MTPAPVSEHVFAGIRSLRSLLLMLLLAAGGCRLKIRSFASDEWIGLVLDEKHRIGLDFAEPECLKFGAFASAEVDKATGRSDEHLVVTGRVSRESEWMRSVDLQSGPDPFLGMSKFDQIRWLEAFLRESLDMARRVESPDQPPAAEE
jgi:hypothetical protein